MIPTKNIVEIEIIIVILAEDPSLIAESLTSLI